MPDPQTAFAVIGAVLMLAALGFGLVQRAPLSFPIIFLGLGVVLGSTGVLRVDSHDRVLSVVATLCLSLVLFLDAVKIDPREVRREWFVPVVILGPGTVLVILLIAVTGAWLIGLAAIPALLFGAVLASTDPVVLRDVVRNPALPGSVRRALTIEAGTNDIVVLPIVLVLIALAAGRLTDVTDWAGLALKILVLSPFAGFLVGGLGSWLVAAVDRRIGIAREYQALYGVGMVLVAYVAGTALGGDGFLASFFAGLAVTVLNHELCDCFLEYGEVTAEMAMLVAFILFGAVLARLVPTVPVLPVALTGIAAILLIRPLVIGAILMPARLSWAARGFIGWFGPRGLNSLLFGLLIVEAGIPGSELLLAMVGIVVIVSVLAHGTTATPLAGLYAALVRRQTLEEERTSTLGGLFAHEATDVPRLDVEDLHRLLLSDDPPVILDVRSRSQYRHDAARIPGAVRVPLDAVRAWGQAFDRSRLVVAYCT